MFDPISLAILSRILVGSLVIVATCYVVETFAKKAATKAKAAKVRKFFVWVIEKTPDIVKLIAQTPGGVSLTSDTTSWDSLTPEVQQTLNNNGGRFMNQYQV